MKGFNYEGLVGQQKEERIKEVKKSGLMDEKRFLLSRNPEMVERLKQFQKAVEDFTLDHSEVISFSLFGSSLKGYAVPESDIDGTLLVDLEKATSRYLDTESKSEFHVKNPDGLKTFLRQYYTNLFRQHLRNALGLEEDQVCHVFVRLVSEEWINKETEKIPIHTFSDLAELFRLNIGSDNVKKYRAQALEKLEKRGKKGERRFRAIMQSLFDVERGNFDYNIVRQIIDKRKLYPKTIEEGKRRFL